MSLAVAIQMDHVSTVDIEADSTFALALEAQKRGHALFHYLPSDLSFREHRILARAQPLRVQREKGKHYELGASEVLDLAGLDVVLMRQDPPFDMAYITATHLLEQIHPSTLVVNDPAQVRNAPEKLFVTHFEGLMPPTLITTDMRQIQEFRAEHKDIIMKPLFAAAKENPRRVVYAEGEDERVLRAVQVVLDEGLARPIVVGRPQVPPQRGQGLLRRGCPAARACTCAPWPAARPSGGRGGWPSTCLEVAGRRSRRPAMCPAAYS